MLIPVLGTPQGKNRLAWLLVRKRLCAVYFLSFQTSPLEQSGLVASLFSLSPSRLLEASIPN